MPALTVQNAEIKTAAVEVKTLTISGKQVTLAVFRQLLESPLINEDGTLSGTPWGTVNYHPDKCADEPEHLHVVWQLGAELRRTKVRHPRHQFKHLSVLGAADYAQWLFCRGGHERTGGLGFTTITIAGIVIGYSVQPATHDRWTAHECKANEERVRACDAIEAAIADARVHRQPYFDRWAEVNDLPQLFIAV